MGSCECGAGWETFSGHRLSCPRNAEAGRIRSRIEREDQDAREAARPTWINGHPYDPEDVPTKAEL